MIYNWNKLTDTDREYLNNLCLHNGFVRRGKAYFRILNEQVLQVVKFSYERHMNHYSLDFGLMSMFSEATKDYFTTKSVLDRYCICCLNNQKMAVSMISDENNFVTFKVASVQEQLSLLENTGMDLLNGIRDQYSLIQSIHRFDLKDWWNDHHKIAPYLSIGDYEHADKVVSAILYQHGCVWGFKRTPWTEEDYEKYEQQFPNTDTDLLAIHNWIVENNHEAIQTYLNNNHAQNMLMAQSILKKQGAL